MRWARAEKKSREGSGMEGERGKEVSRVHRLIEDSLFVLATRCCLFGPCHFTNEVQ